MATRLSLQHTTQIGFTTASGTGDQHIVVLVYPAAAEQIGKLALLQAARVTIVDVFRLRLQLKLCRLEQSMDFEPQMDEKEL